MPVGSIASIEYVSVVVLSIMSVGSPNKVQICDETKFVMRFVFFECRNKIGAACAPLLFGTSGPRVTL
jgi:hypothetical protein